MRFLSIEMKNYRQYRNLKMEFKKGRHDLHVLVADNGVGKTNLLNAFTWCLYGEEPHLGSRGQELGKRTAAQERRVEPKLNKEVLAECAEKGHRIADVEVSIEFEVIGESGARTYRVNRRVPFSITPTTGQYFEKFAEERLTLTEIASETRVYEGEYAKERINKLLPQSIRQYFFFDGEQLNTYFLSHNGERIKEAVYSISQIDMVHEIIRRLQNVVTETRRNASVGKSDTKKLETNLEHAKQVLEGAKNEIKRQSDKRDNLQERLSEVERRLNGVDNVREIEDERKSAEDARQKCAKNLVERRAEYYQFVTGHIADFYLYPAARGSLTRIREMQNEGQLPPSIDPEKLRQSLERGKCEVCGHELSAEERMNIKALIRMFEVSSRTSNILSSMVSELQRTVDFVEKSYSRRRDGVIGALDRAEDALSDAESRLSEAEKKLAKYAGTADEIKKWYDDRQAYTKEINDCSEIIGSRHKTVADKERTVRKLEQQLNSALALDQKTRNQMKMYSFGERALKILGTAEKATVDETRARMERRTEELFRNLVWKESKCERVSLSEKYALALYDRAGFSCAETCSAAERSLLALSFTLAMHEVSGFDSPLFIDTPIARASGENRGNFAKTLVEVSEKKQLILAFTPDEYSEAISDEFEPAIATYIRLKLDESESHVMDPEVEYRGN